MFFCHQLNGYEFIACHPCGFEDLLIDVFEFVLNQGLHLYKLVFVLWFDTNLVAEIVCTCTID